MEKSIHELKAEFVYLVCVYVCVCVCARKKLTALISLQSFLRHIRNINLQGVLLEKVFLEISQNSQGNTPVSEALF